MKGKLVYILNQYNINHINKKIFFQSFILCIELINKNVNAIIEVLNNFEEEMYKTYEKKKKF